MDNIKKYEEVLREHGLKITQGRMEILNILEISTQPISAEEIFDQLVERNQKVNMSTVYRSLEQMEKKGIVTKISFLEEEPKLYEYNHKEHRHYLVCVKCKKVVTIKHCPLHKYDEEVQKETQFSVLGHKLYLYGYCVECKHEKDSVK